MSSLGMVTVTPPELKGVTGEDIVKFDLAYDRYLRQISEINLTRSIAQRVIAAGCKSCISGELLESLVALSVLSDCAQAEEVTNLVVKEWIKERSRCSTNEMSKRVEDAMSRVRLLLLFRSHCLLQCWLRWTLEAQWDRLLSYHTRDHDSCWLLPISPAHLACTRRCLRGQPSACGSLRSILNLTRDTASSTLSEVAETGMSAEGQEELSRLLEEYRDIFRIRLGSDPPAKVRPMKVRLRENHRPYRSTQRRYAPAQRAFISSTIRKLEEVKAVYANPMSSWASPALAVAKPGPEKFQFTVDLRGPNKETVPVASAMPDMEGLLQSVAGSNVSAKLDMCHAYWQIPLHPDSQECMSVKTPIGVLTPTRSLHGSTDSGNHFQACMSEVFSPLSDNFANWQDDALVHARSEAKLLEILRKVFELCRRHRLKLHARKCQLFLMSARFCGRVIDSSGVQFDPQCLGALMVMNSPEYASDLQQFICAVNWMRSSIPHFSRVVAPLHALMEECYKRAGKRTKRPVRKIRLCEQWGTVHEDAFSAIKEQIAH